MEKTTPTPAATASMKHLRKLFVDKLLESTVKHLCTTDVPVSQGRRGRERGWCGLCADGRRTRRE